MNWVALGAIAEAIAALAFLGSFLFVKQQMKQNHDMKKLNGFLFQENFIKIIE